MIPWHQFVTTAPDLAAFGQQRLKSGLAYLATIRPDGGPRVHPISPFLGQGRLFVFMEPTSPKGHDLHRDNRYALHCAVEDTEGGSGEFYITGRAYVMDDPDIRKIAFETAQAIGFIPKERYILFELRVDTALSTTYDESGPVRQRWPLTQPN